MFLYFLARKKSETSKTTNIRFKFQPRKFQLYITHVPHVTYHVMENIGSLLLNAASLQISDKTIDITKRPNAKLCYKTNAVVQ